MPTSAAGSRHRCRQPHETRSGTGGFTLLELLVVIAIIALATAGVGFAMRDSGQATLDREAERLAALLESARAQSRASGAAVRWRPTPDGPGNFSFDGLPTGALPTAWLADGITAQPMAAGAPVAALQLGPDPIIAAQQVLLTSEGPPNRSLLIGTDGLRPFAVIPP
jgi:general secretion pathway protein H